MGYNNMFINSNGVKMTMEGEYQNWKSEDFHNWKLEDYDKDKRSNHEDHDWESDDGFGTMELVLTIASVIGVIIVLVLLCKCCQRRRNRGHVITLPQTSVAVSVPAPYPQQQYVPPVAPSPALAPYPTGPYPPAPYPVCAPTQPQAGYPYPAQMPQPVHLAAPTAPDVNAFMASPMMPGWNTQALPPSYEQATGVEVKNPPYNPYPH